MIKRILVPTDGSEGALVGVRYAVALAKQRDASVYAFYVIDIRLLEGPFVRELSSSFGAGSFASYREDIARILDERADDALGACESLCAEAGVACDLSRMTGNVVASIVEKTELMDLVVMGRQGEHGRFLQGVLGSTTEAVARRARCPVLVTDREYCTIRRFVAAYDGSSHARRALQISADLSEDWEVPFEVLAAGDGRVEQWLDEARSYLDTHTVAVDYVTREGEPAAAIVAYARESGADLIVMGAYGHSKMRELVVGSTTAYTLNHAPCPVLLAR